MHKICTDQGSWKQKDTLMLFPGKIDVIQVRIQDLAKEDPSFWGQKLPT